MDMILTLHVIDIVNINIITTMEPDIMGFIFRSFGALSKTAVNITSMPANCKKKP